MKYKVYAIQGMRFNEIEVEANSKEEAEEIYNRKWNNGLEIYSVDYDEDDVSYVVEQISGEKPEHPLDEIRDDFYRLSNRKQNMIMKQYIDYVENFPDEHDGGSYPVSFLEWYTNDYQEI